MRVELQHIADDSEALRWASGCLLASTRERLHGILGPLPVRLTLALMLVPKVISDLFATALTLAYRMNALRLPSASASPLRGTITGGSFRSWTPCRPGCTVCGCWQRCSM